MWATFIQSGDGDVITRRECNRTARGRRRFYGWKGESRAKTKRERGTTKDQKPGAYLVVGCWRTRKCDDPPLAIAAALHPCLHSTSPVRSTYRNASPAFGVELLGKFLAKKYLCLYPTHPSLWGGPIYYLNLPSSQVPPREPCAAPSSTDAPRASSLVSEVCR